MLRNVPVFGRLRPRDGYGLRSGLCSLRRGGPWRLLKLVGSIGRWSREGPLGRGWSGGHRSSEEAARRIRKRLRR